MTFPLSLSLLALALLSFSLGAKVQQAPLTLLYQNNLNYTDDVNHRSFLYIETSVGLSEAARQCANLRESLLSTADARSSQDDLAPLLAYAISKGDLQAKEILWLADGTMSYNGDAVQFQKASKQMATTKGRPLCTQSDRETLGKNSHATSSNRITVGDVGTGQNTYAGYRNQKGFRFFGIPYSDNPGRWEYAGPVKSTGKDYDATTIGAECFQTGGGNMSEQCLFLNIFTPFLPGSAPSKTRLRPVAVWIHGGAFTGGSGGDTTFEGGNMNSRGDVILVNINYRLSTLGFLAIPNTTIRGNYGIADQILALQWVRENIKTFGGDPDRVTIYGQSAGAASVRALLASPKARGLFAAAIAGSNLGGYDYGTTYSHYLTVDEEYQMVGEEIVKNASCSTAASVEQCLKSASASSLVNQANPARFIIVDGNIITQPQLDVVRPEKTAHVPTLWGIMAEDGNPFISYPTLGESREEGIDSILNGQQSTVAQAVIARESLFPVPDGNNETLRLFNLTSNIATDVEFRCVDQATVYSAVKNDVFPSTWFYQYERAYATGFDPNSGTCDAPITQSHPFGDPSLSYFRSHSGDLYFAFASLAEFGLHFRDDKDLPFTQLIMDYWTSFVTNHDPNPKTAYLQTRQYVSTLETVQSSGQWSPIVKGDKTGRNSLRLLDFPPRQASFQRQEQCNVLGLPVTLYESNS